MGKPIIGLTVSYRSDEQTQQHFLQNSYLDAIRHFGGIPLLIPVMAVPEELAFLMSQCDGLLLTGGNDIDPALFGEKVLNDTVVIAPERDRDEFKALKIAQERGIPILGICRGVQVMNVYFGGTLIQDIPTQTPSDILHRMEPPFHRAAHKCTVIPDTPLHNLTQVHEIGVNSHHHQAIKDVATGFTVMAEAEDHVIEAICDPAKPFRWGVQWHPERIWDIEESSAKIFEAFISACKA